MEQAGKVSLVELVHFDRIHHLRHEVNKNNPTQNELDLALHEAARRGNQVALEILLQAGANVNAVDIHGQNVLLHAIMGRNENVVKMLLEAGFPVSPEDVARVGPPRRVIRAETDETHQSNGVPTSDDELVVEDGAMPLTETFPPIHLAINISHYEMVKMLVDSGADLEAADLDGDTPLIASAHTGQLEMVQFLLASGCKIDGQGYEGSTAIGRACERDHVPIVELFLSAGANPSIPNDNGETPLLIAVSLGHIECVKLLLDKGANLHHLNHSKEGVILKAVESGLAHLLQLLIDKGADVNVQSEKGETALNRAAEYKNAELIEILLGHNADPNAVGPGGMVALHWCAYFGLDKCVQLLCADEKVDVNIINSIPATPAIMAVRNDNLCCVDWIIKRSDFDPNIRAFGGRTILHWLVEALDTPKEYLRALFKHDLSVNRRDNKGDTALVLAASNKNFDVMHMILEKDPDVNIAGTDGRTALHWMAELGETDMVKRLLDVGADINLTDDEDCTPLLLASKAKQVDNVRKLIMDGVVPETELASAMIESARVKQISTIECLLQKGASVNADDDAGTAPLQCAAHSGLIEVLEPMLKANAYLNHIDFDHTTAITAAASQKHFDIVRLLLTHEIDVNELPTNGRTALYYAARWADSDCVQALLDAGAKPNLGRHDFPLKAAVERGRTEIVEKLIKAGGNVEICDPKGRKPVHWAASQGHADTLDLLLRYGADPLATDDVDDSALTLASWNKNTDVLKQLIPISEISHTELDHGMSALHLAVLNDYQEGIELLIGGGAEVSQTDMNNENSIILASKHTTSSETLLQLLQHRRNTDVNAIGSKGRTALHWAVGDLECCKALIQNGADINLIDQNGASILQLAIAHKQEDAAIELISHGCDIRYLHKDGRLPIHHACIFGLTRVVEALLQKGIDVDTRAEDSKTPILIACIEGHVDVVKILVQYGCTINEVFFEAITPLYMATLNEHHRIMKTLIDAGADPDLIGPQKISPLVTSCLKGDMRSIAMLIQANANMDVDVSANRELHPLRAAAGKNQTRALILLSTFMCDVNYIRKIMNESPIYLFIDDQVIFQFLRSCAEAPKSLQMLSRKVIRNSVGYPVAKRLLELNVPQMVKDFLGFKDIWKLLQDDAESQL